MEEWSEPVDRQLSLLVDAFERHLQGNLLGVYLHGSLAMGCFNPHTSDLDLLAVTVAGVAAASKQSLIETLLECSRHPHPVEVSFLAKGDLWPWRHPGRFQLHFSESWRSRFAKLISTQQWPATQGEPETDADLAAHVTVTRERGVCLWGAAIEEALPVVPGSDYLASILGDLSWARERASRGLDLIYATLNAARVSSYLRERRVMSKVEGAAASLAHLPARYHPLVATALQAYQGQDTAGLASDRSLVESLMDHVLRQSEGVDS